MLTTDESSFISGRLVLEVKWTCSDLPECTRKNLQHRFFNRERREGARKFAVPALPWIRNLVDFQALQSFYVTNCRVFQALGPMEWRNAATGFLRQINLAIVHATRVRVRFTLYVLKRDFVLENTLPLMHLQIVDFRACFRLVHADQNLISSPQLHWPQWRLFWVNRFFDWVHEEFRWNLEFKFQHFLVRFVNDEHVRVEVAEKYFKSQLKTFLVALTLRAVLQRFLSWKHNRIHVQCKSARMTHSN